MARPTPMDERFVHQIPELLPEVDVRSPHWRESYFFEFHRPDAHGDVVFFTMAHYPAREMMDSLQMGRIDGEQVLGVVSRPYDGDPHTTDVGGARVEVVEPFEELRLTADPEVAAIGLDLTFRAPTQPYGLRRGTMRAADDLVWDQCHILQSGIYRGTYTVDGRVHDVAYEDQRVLVELDGRLGHQGAARVDDGIRDRRSATQGWLTVRGFWVDVAVTPCSR